MPPERHSLTRRNGQPQACEMCRKAKIRCDHGAPICGRCARRNLGCNYHPAPLTRARESGSPAIHSAALNKIESFPTDSFRWSTAENQINSVRGQPRSPPSHDLEESDGTPFPTIFSKPKGSFAKNVMDTVEDEQRSGLIDYHNRPTVDQLDRGVKILLEFPTHRTYLILSDELPYLIDLWLSPIMIRTCLAQIWSEYGKFLGQTRSVSELSKIASDLFTNDKSATIVGSSSSWENWFGGHRLRWQMLSILFSFFGRAFKQREEWDPVFALPEQQGRNRTSAAENMASCAKMCLDISDDDKPDDLVACALKNYWKLKSNILSDNDNDLQKGDQAVMGLFIATSLHRLPQTMDITPLTQYRSSLAASLYYLDKSSSFFSGRPPLLTRQYCHCPMPLDLTEEELYAGPEVLASAKSDLDSSGWNKSKTISAISMVRALSCLSPIMERILELSLGVNVQFTEATIGDLEAQIDDITRSYPSHLNYGSIKHWSQSLENGRPAHELYIIARIHLDVLRCRFLVQRLNVSRCHDTGQALLDIAQETMAVMLSIWLKRDYLRRYNYALNWLAVSYGIPCAGVLCTELLRSSTPTTSLSSSPLIFSKSDIIQSLTIYITFLGWVRPTDGNAEMCWKLKNVVKRIVDNFIDSSAVVQPPPDLIDMSGNMEGAIPAISDWDSLDWLNTIDWTQGDWLDTDEPFL